MAKTDRERALAHHGLGWIAFSEGRYTEAEGEFRQARKAAPGDRQYDLALAWALARAGGMAKLRAAADLLDDLLRWRDDPSAHVCLGVVYFKLDSLYDSEHHLRRALELDPCQGSYTDLGALYAFSGRRDEAEAELRKAIERDQGDAVAHVEFGALLLSGGEDRLAEAMSAFKRVAVAQPASAPAAIGLAQCLLRSHDERGAEDVLNKAVRRADAGDAWRLHLALARMLMERADKQQSFDLYSEAYASAVRAIGGAPDTEADPHFVAGVAHRSMGAQIAVGGGRFTYQRTAAGHFRACLKRSADHAGAQRGRQLLKGEMRAGFWSKIGTVVICLVAIAILGTTWAGLFLSKKVTGTMATSMTVVAAVLIIVAFLLRMGPVKLKALGIVEAELSVQSAGISPGPTGELTFGPGQLDLVSGPSGQFPRRM
jgi:Tfp pilus assembly protein PilF